MVLIDMEMPKNCAECEVKEAAKCGTDYKYLFKHEKYYDSIRPDCPLKEHFPLKQITIIQVTIGFAQKVSAKEVESDG